ncbi:ClbS/DfsB family four-helix bundle protein [Helicobacter saguini]|uniref:ClbS/DfsB family four-helix bundle protein n=1 Tax=Helicobacter saguini TaxID=1548018 RepID=A0A347VTK3_9HELI|nr:ClbS/DfsB family four-helix bundle protein [Helicobacter saguini]MWV62059.1 ClbS/DfsB family four-helix bundle protein [Helicobacter saguini]MWV67267.1 ClbS/DfsB family four-helix bundle protein [Helicobacter saguini]MWV69620.1 ClbS/DfsB family four-helix bundle protein [Helicobacter saguini]MWV70829.1 ClbS/DfsB family four-helix bundle protein [Helicobacter saguini]TLD94331.1 ClbS/DfsB family four-helix bundle protein [Helicobacter saguini]
MARAKNKGELLESTQNEFAKLFKFIESIPPRSQISPFKNALKGNSRDKNLRDVLIHLYEWHILLLNFTQNITRITPLPFFPNGYNWKTYPKLNCEFHAKHQGTDLESAKALLIASHADIMRNIENLSEIELFGKNFAWCGNVTLGSYYVSSGASHYIWALKTIKDGFKGDLKS